MSAIAQTNSINSIQLKPEATQVAKQVQAPTQETVKISADKVGIKPMKRGIVPTLKGAGMGALGGGVVGGAAVALMGAPKWAPVGVIVGGISGALSGGVAANLTDKKAIATVIGAGVGLATVPLQAKLGLPINVATAAIVTSLGAAGGFASSFVAQREGQ